MLDMVLFLFAVAVAGAGGSSGGMAADEAAPAPSQPAVLREAEDQTPSGKFLTAGEVKMILTATKPNWIAVREYNGQDLVYFTQILSWRCGLYEIRYAINGGPMQVWPMPDCHADTAAPNAITPDDGLPYAAFALGSVESVEIELLYDDLSTDSASYARSAVLMP